MKNTMKSNKCSQTFCKKVLKKTRKSFSNTIRKARIVLEKRQKELKQKISIAETKGNKTEFEKLSNEHEFNYELINSFKKIKIDEVIKASCNKLYCNPGCKNMLITQKENYNKILPKEFITELKKNGATSACISQKPLEDIF